MRALPEWFGIESATQMYIDGAGRMETIVATIDSDPVGFLTIERHFPETAEIYCIGVLSEHHSTGIGRRLLEAAERYLAEDGARFLQVKTLAPERESPEYAKTRAFYDAVGFKPFEVFPQLWGPDNPCLVLVKTLEP